MVQYVDHSVVAQLGTPDMRGPIAYGLAWPERVRSGASALDFSAMGALTFESVREGGHPRRFPGLALAWEVLAAPEGATAVLNAANEVAVAAFLERKIRFDQIDAVNRDTLAHVSTKLPRSLDDLLELDALSRRAADAVVSRLGR
jgi:1-deoxy-D-xylulose-5-phosphate reductoisomerase